MTMTRADIDNVSFAISKKGYDVDEVDVFLEKVADEIERMTNTILQLREQLNNKPEPEEETKSAPSHGTDSSEINYDEIDDEQAKEILAEKDSIIEQLQKDLEDKNADDSAISQALIVAQRSADDIIAKANTQADTTIHDARDEADRIISRAESEKDNIMAAIAKLEEEREECRNGYADVLRDFIEDANIKLNNLGFDDDVDAIPYNDAKPISTRPSTGQLQFENNDPDKTTAVPATGVVEKDMSGFGDLSDDEGDLD